MWAGRTVIQQMHFKNAERSLELGKGKKIMHVTVTDK